ncbi:uncharacterized protein LOC126740331 [Anthonomus grandis grandis]|uniref:uncharacterized protein LOC126740331 n=1 Tax=Anthonomus grandis grandis TaxID=2921223 RepID=UPI00216542B8|nr:uncharacterized protein LOC126740331 [Anthonomus grandis grandis]
MMSDDDCSISETLPELTEAVNAASLELLPIKSRNKYNYAYSRFMDYRTNKNVTSFSENVVMAYFLELGSKINSSTLWANYSMLKATLAIRHDVDISEYSKLRAFLKQQAHAYKPKKSKILTKEEINKFIQEAPDKEYLMIKVAVIFGISGACRMDELVKMTVQDIQDLLSKLLVTIPDSKTNTSRSFIVIVIVIQIKLLVWKIFNKIMLLVPKFFQFSILVLIVK